MVSLIARPPRLLAGRCLLSVDAVVVTYNSALESGKSLPSVRRSLGAGRMVVVDNASLDDSVGVAHSEGADIVVANKVNVGFARAVNQGLAFCSADHVLLLNPDATLGADSLERMRATLRDQRDAVIVAPLLREADGKTNAGAGRFATVSRRVGMCLPALGRAKYFDSQYRLCASAVLAGRPVPVDYVFGAAMLVDRAFLASVGGLDERFFLFAEDEDLCRQAHAGRRRVLLDTAAVVWHIGGASCADGPLTEAQRLYSTYLLLEKWRGRCVAAAYHFGMARASWLRVQAARAERKTDAAAAIGRMTNLFDEAVLTRVDPLRVAGAG